MSRSMDKCCNFAFPTSGITNLFTIMELKIGDKVRFLNEKGGGIITKLISTTMVHVAIEEGFEVPVMVSDLVKIDPNGMANRFFDRPINIKQPIVTEITQNVRNDKQVGQAEKNTSVNNTELHDPVKPLYRQSGAGITEGIYLLWEPADQKWLITGNLSIILVNNTPFEAIYSFMLEENNVFSGVGYDVVPAYSQIHIETITREDLEAWSGGIVQVIFHAEEMDVLLQPLHARFRLKPSRFFKETSYQEFKLTGSKNIILNLGDVASQKLPPEGSFEKADLDPAARQKVEAVAPAALIDRHRTGPREAEVDLHISALRSDYPTMPQSDILLYQLDYFENMLSSAIAFNYNKVIFIHGIGNGVLKTAIINKLKDYENIELAKAPFAQYGNGAIQINIHS
ncbi:MAG TPA: DUF2027 domain-containing protein [Lentimicrobium sp.]|nr:DUF2027 domain-containing protein [Lentimicrobium sp.]